MSSMDFLKYYYVLNEFVIDLRWYNNCCKWMYVIIHMIYEHIWRHMCEYLITFVNITPISRIQIKTHFSIRCRVIEQIDLHMTTTFFCITITWDRTSIFISNSLVVIDIFTTMHVCLITWALKSFFLLLILCFINLVIFTM